MEKFTIGLAVGAIIGMAIIANSQKTRRLFIKSQDELKSKIDEMIDEKLDKLDEMIDGNEDYEPEDDEPVSRKFKKKRTN